MNDIEKIKQEIEYNLSYITSFTAENKVLQEKLDKLQLENWQPDSGDSDSDLQANPEALP